MTIHTDDEVDAAANDADGDHSNEADGETGGQAGGSAGAAGDAGGGAPPPEPIRDGDGPEPIKAEPIKAIPLRHPGGWVAALILLALLGLFGYGAATNSAYHWDIYQKYLLDRRMSEGALVTLEVTAIAMAIGFVLGGLLAAMRMSGNVVLKAIAWGYAWIFRGIPIYLQLVFWALIALIYQHVDLGVPFAVQWAHIDVRDTFTAFFFACLGLGLNEAASWSQVARSGIAAVEKGQTEAAAALGMSRWATMRHIVLPQAMRTIVPATGAQLINLLKTTSLVFAVLLTSDLYNRSHEIGERVQAPVPLLLVAMTWYLGMVSILSILQFLLERRYNRGTSRRMTRRQLRLLANERAKAAI